EVLAQRDGLALQLRGQSAEVAEYVGAAQRLRARLGADRVAGLGGYRSGQLLDVRLQFLSDAGDQLAALARRSPAPGSERVVGRAHRAVDVLGAAPRHHSQDGSVGGVLDLDGAPVGAVHPLPADQHLPDRALDLDRHLRYASSVTLSGSNRMSASFSK